MRSHGNGLTLTAASPTGVCYDMESDAARSATSCCKSHYARLAACTLPLSLSPSVFPPSKTKLKFHFQTQVSASARLSMLAKQGGCGMGIDCANCRSEVCARGQGRTAFVRFGRHGLLACCRITFSPLKTR